MSWGEYRGEVGRWMLGDDEEVDREEGIEVGHMDFEQEEEEEEMGIRRVVVESEGGGGWF